MGAISERASKGGSVGYPAAICTQRNGQIVHNESKTFMQKPAAAGLNFGDRQMPISPCADHHYRRNPRQW